MAVQESLFVLVGGPRQLHGIVKVFQKPVLCLPGTKGIEGKLPLSGKVDGLPSRFLRSSAGIQKEGKDKIKVFKDTLGSHNRQVLEMHFHVVNAMMASTASP